MAGWVALLWAALAGAGDVPGLERAWMDLDRGNWDRAIADASARLHADPTDLEAHRVLARATGSKEPDAAKDLARTYRTWLEAEPGLPAARFGLAMALYATFDKDRCDEALGLIDPLPDAPAMRYAALRIALDVDRRCAQDAAPAVEAELAALGEEAGDAAWSWAIWYRTRDSGSWDEALGALDRIAERAPNRLGPLAALAAEAKGKTGKTARLALLAQVDPWLTGDDPVRLWTAYEVVRRLNVGKAAAARARLDRIDPFEPHGFVRLQSGGADDRLLSAVHDANRRPTHQLAIDALQILDAELPPTGAAREAWAQLLSQRLEAVGRDGEAFAVQAALARSAPDDGATVNAWAYACAVRGEQLDEALAAMDRVMPQLDAADLGGDDPVDWAARRRGNRGAWGDTRGWLLYRLGRTDEAVAALSVAAQMYADGVILAHLGLALRAAGRDAEAFDVLVAAEVARIGEEPLAADAHAALEALWPGTARWHPLGLYGYLADRRAPPPPSVADAAPARPDKHPLVGKRFPLADAPRLDGGKIDLVAPADGLLVVDFWATWCGPCVQGMPHLQEVAEAYADEGVRVVGLSVDEQKAAVTAFYRGAPQPAYALGHVGRPGWDAMQLSGIPALFVVDATGTIAAMFSGYGPGDTRLERKLDELLGR